MSGMAGIIIKIMNKSICHKSVKTSLKTYRIQTVPEEIEQKNTKIEIQSKCVELRYEWLMNHALMENGDVFKKVKLNNRQLG